MLLLLRLAAVKFWIDLGFLRHDHHVRLLQLTAATLRTALLAPCLQHTLLLTAAATLLLTTLLLTTLLLLLQVALLLGLRRL